MTAIAIARSEMGEIVLKRPLQAAMPLAGHNSVWSS